MSRSKSTRSWRRPENRRTNGREARLSRVRRDVSIRSIRRGTPDTAQIGRAVVQMALREAEAERAAQAESAAGSAGPDHGDAS